MKAARQEFFSEQRFELRAEALPTAMIISAERGDYVLLVRFAISYEQQEMVARMGSSTKRRHVSGQRG